MNKEPETYEELIRYKKCVDLTRYYHLTESNLQQIYDFLEANPDGEITGNKYTIVLKSSNKVESTIIKSLLFAKDVDAIRVTNKNFIIVPHYEPAKGSKYSGGGFSSGGSSSNNNNNNNNNNNR